MIAKHIGIVAVSAEGAALCYRTICAEGAAVFGRHAHPEVSMHTYTLSEYIRHIEADRWADVGSMLLSSAAKLHQAGADFLICPDNTVHQGLDLVRDASPPPWLHIAEEVGNVALERGFRRLLVLGTKSLMEGPVYPGKLHARGIETGIPPAEQRRHVNTFIYDELVRGEFKDSTRTVFQEIIDWSDIAITDGLVDFGGLFHWGGDPLVHAVLAIYDGPIDRASLPLARFLAACRGVGDVAFGLETSRREYIDAGVRALSLCLGTQA